jgi:hypothetical protein
MYVRTLYFFVEHEGIYTGETKYEELAIVDDKLGEKFASEAIKQIQHL